MHGLCKSAIAIAHLLSVFVISGASDQKIYESILSTANEEDLNHQAKLPLVERSNTDRLGESKSQRFIQSLTQRNKVSPQAAIAPTLDNTYWGRTPTIWGSIPQSFSAIRAIKSIDNSGSWWPIRPSVWGKRSSSRLKDPLTLATLYNHVPQTIAKNGFGPLFDTVGNDPSYWMNRGKKPSITDNTHSFWTLRGKKDDGWLVGDGDGKEAYWTSRGKKDRVDDAEPYWINRGRRTDLTIPNGEQRNFMQQPAVEANRFKKKYLNTAMNWSADFVAPRG